MKFHNLRCLNLTSAKSIGGHWLHEFIQTSGCAVRWAPSESQAFQHIDRQFALVWRMTEGWVTPGQAYIVEASTHLVDWQAM